MYNWFAAGFRYYLGDGLARIKFYLNTVVLNYFLLGLLFPIAVAMLPLSTPILATTGVITLVASWNNFFLPLLVFSDQTKYTLPLGVMDFMGQHMSRWNLVLGYVTLALIPAVIFFVFAQKYIVAGLTGGSVKG